MSQMSYPIWKLGSHDLRWNREREVADPRWILLDTHKQRLWSSLFDAAEHFRLAEHQPTYSPVDHKHLLIDDYYHMRCTLWGNDASWMATTLSIRLPESEAIWVDHLSDLLACAVSLTPGKEVPSTGRVNYAFCDGADCLVGLLGDFLVPLPVGASRTLILELAGSIDRPWPVIAVDIERVSLTRTRFVRSDSSKLPTYEWHPQLDAWVKR